MKKWIQQGLLLLFLCSIAGPTYASARKDFKKTIKKEFDIRKDGEVEIENKFGKVEINTWDKNKVQIEVTIIARADSESEAEKVFDRISIHFSNGDDYVSAKTEIQSKKSSWSWWNGGSDGNDYAINYDIYLPASVELDLSNRHGSAVIARLKGDASIDIAHGEVSAEGFEGELELDFAHSDGNFGQVNQLKADVAHSDAQFSTVNEAEFESAHSDVEIKSIKLLRLDSRHSDIEIGEVGELRVDTRHDDFEVESVDVIISEAQHTRMDIEYLRKLGDFEGSHGGATIDKLAANFQSVNMHGSHTTYRIEIERGAKYQLDASGSHAGISYPDGMNVSYEKDKNSEKEIRGHIGSGKDGGLIKARLSHGSLRVKQ